ncbi:aminoglycoside phosphotransferase family protein [Sphingobacterium sp. SGG-5]|uniref:phosphotransferase family protein n=1 Tax=Sphingobacterium sp. SGG-5 TaxID=2710881 RepID=UPI0013EA3BD8|nr:aminoglycoside phosphotransferase family protein [Sphingobacterium sp. SGG-5]NGM60417.1 aminoglycoside phosphotransferase family protein [Sphingobacterium sp. SGG-5]
MISRENVYYWKSDRPYAAGNTHRTAAHDFVTIESQLFDYLNQYFRERLVELALAGGQGNHITYIANYGDKSYFVRLENGPEKDDYMLVGSKVMESVKSMGVPVPTVYLTDVSRLYVPFAIQVMDLIPDQDLNILEKSGTLDVLNVAASIGKNVAKWQSVRLDRYGLFKPESVRDQNILEGYHDSYEQYFFLNWDIHLDFLQSSGFLGESKIQELNEVVVSFRHLLQLDEGCLVHKDLALWNILGNNSGVSAFIDWDDAVSGDPVDDLSLLGCFHSGEVILAVMAGYQQEKPLPENFEQRFWLHLLRNIIFKSVIRVKGNYFDMSDKFFLNNVKNNSLEKFTLDRIDSAVKGLKGNLAVEML